MSDLYIDVTDAYQALPTCNISDLSRHLTDHFYIGDLIRTRDGRVLLPAGPDEANLFRVYARTWSSEGRQVYVVGEFDVLADADDLLDELEDDGWPVKRWSDALGPIARKAKAAQPADGGK